MAEATGQPQPAGWTRRCAVLGLGLLLASCGGVVPRTQGPPPPREAPIVRPTRPGMLPGDETRHRIALLVPMSGANAAVGQSIANAATLALTDTGGKDLRVTTYDTAGGAAAAATKALNEGAELFLGPLLAEDARQVGAVARARGVPVIAFSNDASVAGNGTYLLGFSPAQSIERVVHYARKQGATRFAALTPQGAYGRTASNALLRAVEDAGGTVVAIRSYDRSPRSLAAAAGALKGQGYDAVLIADGGRIALQAAPLLGRRGRLLGTELWNAEAGIGRAPALSGAWFASVSDGLYVQLAQKYRARYGRAPFRLASLGYDAVLLVVRIAADWPVGARFPVGRMGEADGFSGIDGAFRFGRDNIAERALEVRQLGPGGATVIAPAAQGFK